MRQAGREGGGGGGAPQRPGPPAGAIEGLPGGGASLPKRGWVLPAWLERVQGGSRRTRVLCKQTAELLQERIGKSGCRWRRGSRGSWAGRTRWMQAREAERGRGQAALQVRQAGSDRWDR
jgi:hypothetical protein